MIGCSDGNNGGARAIAADPEPLLVEPSQVADEFGPHAVGHQRLVAIDANRDNRSIPYDVWYPVDAVDSADQPSNARRMLAL